MTFRKQTRGRGGTGGRDERGQSEVIGTILLVAIVIIMAAGVGQFVFGLDIVTFDKPTVGPQASFGVTERGDMLIIDHKSGDALDMEEITIQIPDQADANTDQLEDEWTSGEELEVSSIDPGDTVRIIWKSSETDDSNVIFEHEFEG